MNVEALRDYCRNYLRDLDDDYSQDELAASLGVSLSWLNKFLNGHCPNLRLKRLQKICNWVEADRVMRTGKVA